MCGIAGFFDWASPPHGDRRQIASGMSQNLSHRGPDALGQWCPADVPLGLSHARLAIVDLSPTGAQPMTSHSGRFTIVFNGEIYNFMDLREELQALGAKFRGGSDTEVLLAGFEHWGINTTISRLIGMFAFGVWDSKNRTLLIARDRMGIKPVYWTLQNGVFGFASELRALKPLKQLTWNIDRKSVGSFLRLGYVPAPHSIFESVHKLAPGHTLELDTETKTTRTSQRIMKDMDNYQKIYQWV